MSPAHSHPEELSAEELRELRALSLELDELLEESLKSRESLTQTFARVLPRVRALVGASGAVVTTRNEELMEETFSDGDFGGTFPGRFLADQPWGISRAGADTFVSQPLDVSGVKVGGLGLLFPGVRTAEASAARLRRVLEVIAEELDTVLAAVHTAAEKHHVIVRFNQLLSNRVFEVGMDQAVQALCEKVRIPGFLLVYRDAVVTTQLHYRAYRHGALEHASGERPFPSLEAAIAASGERLIAPGDERLRQVLPAFKAAEAVLIASPSNDHTLGKMLVWSAGEGFSAFTMDLLRVLASTLSQRLVDYNRERIHLAQFFSSAVIDELLTDPAYEQNHLSAREREVGILFADINGFTRICEQVLEGPQRIGHFVDHWSQGVVRILWEHGGVFDKMIGDCVVALFGPPFFTDTPVRRAEAAVRAAIKIQDFTARVLSTDPEVARLNARIQEVMRQPGLGVAIGINLAPTYCGLFGPNRQYTGFSSGMNQAARLQSLGGFREILVMESVRRALEQSDDPALKQLKLGPLRETAVKNVGAPLRYCSVSVR